MLKLNSIYFNYMVPYDDNCPNIIEMLQLQQVEISKNKLPKQTKKLQDFRLGGDFVQQSYSILDHM